MLFNINWHCLPIITLLSKILMLRTPQSSLFQPHYIAFQALWNPELVVPASLTIQVMILTLIKDLNKSYFYQQPCTKTEVGTFLLKLVCALMPAGLQEWHLGIQNQGLQHPWTKSGQLDAHGPQEGLAAPHRDHSTALRHPTSLPTLGRERWTTTCWNTPIAHCVENHCSLSNQNFKGCYMTMYN